MRILIDQLEKSLDQPLYFISLMAALTIPDIGGAIDSDDGTAKADRYAAWYDRWAKPQFTAVLKSAMPESMRSHVKQADSPMTGELCYQFRCSLLHQGRMANPPKQQLRIMFIQPGANSNIVHYNVINDALTIDIRMFCKEMILGVRDWLKQVEQTEKYQRNYERFAHLHLNGLLPYIGGVPVIA
jgi:hypothetical protein